MARTTRRTENVRSYYSREAKWARKMTNRKARNQTNEVLRAVTDLDAMLDPRPRSTGGWITH